MAGKRQVQNPRYGLQHNIGLGGAAVVTLYRRASLSLNPNWVDPTKRFGYNPAVEARPVTRQQVQGVMSTKGSLLGTRSQLKIGVLETSQSQVSQAKL
jgi:sterol carrier protein 2